MDSRSCGIPARFQKSGEATFNYPYSTPTIGHDEREIAVTLPRNVGHALAKSPVTITRNTHSDATSPAQGTEVNGPTASIKSVSHLEHVNLSQGSVFNMRLHPASVNSVAGMAHWANLVRTYFDLGGWEVQFNVVDAEELKKAQEHPEDYKDLVVRVVGYSAFFVELEKFVQDDIISRTEFDLH